MNDHERFRFHNLQHTILREIPDGFVLMPLSYFREDVPDGEIEKWEIYLGECHDLVMNKNSDGFHTRPLISYLKEHKVTSMWPNVDGPNGMHILVRFKG